VQVLLDEPPGFSEFVKTLCALGRAQSPIHLICGVSHLGTQDAAVHAWTFWIRVLGTDTTEKGRYEKNSWLALLLPVGILWDGSTMRARFASHIVLPPLSPRLFPSPERCCSLDQALWARWRGLEAAPPEPEEVVTPGQDLCERRLPFPPWDSGEHCPGRRGAVMALPGDPWPA